MEGSIDDSAMFELLGRHLAGECSPDEAAMVAQWLQQSPENQKTLEALQIIWSQAPAPDPQAQAREDAAWNRLQARMHAPATASSSDEGGGAVEPQVLQMPKPDRNRLRLWRLAAMLAIAVSIGMVFYLNQIRKNPVTELLTVASGVQPLTDTLPDGTIVNLNAHSSIVYPAQFAAGERVVQLEGEAFFEVAHDAAHPFRIHAGATDVRVLGTSFNLSTRGARVRVAVQTGKVELSERDSLQGQPRAKLLLTAGMAGSYDGSKKALRQEQGEVENDQFWRTGNLVFRDAPMARVVEQLNAVFADSIALSNPGLARCHLSTSFTRPSIDSVITVIAETFDLKVTHNGNLYQLDGEPCE